MKKTFSLLVLMTLAISCSSVTHLKGRPVCAVWKTQKYMGAYSIEVTDKKVQWAGDCKGSHWKCKEINFSYDERGNVLMDDKDPVGVIIEDKFTSTKEELKLSSLLVDVSAREVKGSSEAFFFNDKCSPQDAIIGTIALTLISETQKK